MPERKHDGVKKRCKCKRKRWSECLHPWHFDFHHCGREHRHSLDVVARERGEKPPTDKPEALKWRDRLRIEIREHGHVLTMPVVPTTEAAPDTRLTLKAVTDLYLKEFTPGRRDAAVGAMKSHIGLLCRTEIPAGNGKAIPFADKPLAEVTPNDIEAFRSARRGAFADARKKWNDAATLDTRAATLTNQDEAKALREQAEALRKVGGRQPGGKDGEIGINRVLARLRHICTWAITREPSIIDRHPFKKHGESVVHLATETGRSRRLVDDEEDRLLTHAQPHLHAVIVAALETGCRIGELLSLTWGDVLWTEVNGKPTVRAFKLSGSKTKTFKSRTVPVSSRLRAVLEMRRNDPAGKPLGPSKHVFGNEVGEQVGSVKTAWHATLRRAGIVDLHVHDLRREFASRLLESGATLAEVQAWLGHANISMTSKYLGVTDAGLQRALKQFEAARGPIRTRFAQTVGTPLGSDTSIPPEDSDNRLVQ